MKTYMLVSNATFTARDGAEAYEKLRAHFANEAPLTWQAGECKVFEVQPIGDEQARTVQQGDE